MKLMFNHLRTEKVEDLNCEELRVDSPWFRAEAVPGQLEQLKAQTQKNCVLITNGSH